MLRVNDREITDIVQLSLLWTNFTSCTGSDIGFEHNYQCCDDTVDSWDLQWYLVLFEIKVFYRLEITSA